MSSTESSPIAARICELVQAQSGQAALVFQDTEERTCHSPQAMWDMIERITSRLQAAGIQRGDRLAWLSLNHIAQLAALVACARIGAIWVPLNFRLAVPELQQVIADAQPKLLVADHAHESVAQALSGDIPHQLSIAGLLDADARSNEATRAETISALSGEANDPVLLVYTSGTTGRPKGALHTQQALMNNAAASHWAHGFKPDDCVLSTLPMFHVGGLCIQTLPAWLAGASVILHARFDPALWLKEVETSRPTLSLLVPATLRAVIEHPAWDKTDLSALRGLMTGSSVVPRAYLEAFHQRGVPVGQVYGTTETGPVSIVLRFHEAMTHVGSTGQPQPNAKLKLLDEQGTPVAHGTVGEITIHADNLMSGYWNASAQTGVGLEDGWFRSGDLGMVDRDGRLTIVGRNKDMIISGGENIYPAEVENLMVTLPGVAECAVVGLPDARWGEVPVLSVVRTTDPPGQQLQASDIQDHLSAQVARYKLPKKIVFLDTLPKSALGKVLKPQLRELLLAREWR